jgi:glycosyltransferase involved in cell wall biosynthesis
VGEPPGLGLLRAGLNRVHAALVIHGGLSGRSGGFLYDRMLVERLRARGHTVDVLELPWSSYARCLTRNLGGRWLHAVTGFRGDIVIQDELAHPSLVAANRIRRARGEGPSVAIVHLLRSSEARAGADRTVSRRVERAYLRGVDGTIFNSRATRGAVEALVGGQVKGVVVTPGGDRLGPGPGDGEIEARSREPGALRVLFAANLLPAKGLTTLLRALSRLPPGCLVLTVAGSPDADRSYASRVRRDAARQEREGRVRFVGHLDGEDLAREFRSHHVLAVPSRYEAFGIAYLEAMGFGLVPLGTTRGGASEVIRDGETGFLVPPGDEERIAEALLGLHQDRGRLGRMARAARRDFAAHPGWARVMDEACEYLQAVASGGREG